MPPAPPTSNYGILTTGPDQQQLDLGIDPEPTPVASITHPDGGNLPHWIQAEVDDHSDHRPRWGKTKHFRCKTCSEIVIAWSGDFHPGYDVTLDPTPLNAQEELACHLTQRWTAIVTIGGRMVDVVDFRNQWNMSRQLGTSQVILPTHRCGARFAGFHSPPAPPATETSSEPTF